MRVVVIGAGVVGATTALALAESGVEVTVIDAADGVAKSTSLANGGGVTPLHSEPWNSPGLAGKLLKFAGRDDAPWRLPPSQLPKLGRWGLAFLRQSSRTAFTANARANIRLGLYSLEAMRDWRERYGFDYVQTTAGSMQVFHDDQVLADAYRQRRELIEDLGEVQRLDVDGVVDRESALGPAADRLAGGLYYPGHESGDAAAFARCAAAKAEALGASLGFSEAVRAFDCTGGRLKAVVTEHGRIEADACIVATGAETPSLLKPLGLRVPIQPVRGYSATFEIDRNSGMPTLPLLDVTHRFVTLRLGPDSLRVAGLADFAGHDRSVPASRVALLLDGARRLLPDLADELRVERAAQWAGLRPVTPDGRPLLGSTAVEGFYLNAGHGPMGWCFAAGSARLLADLITGGTPAIDWRPYDARR